MKKYSITSKYTAAVPRSQRRKNVEGRSVVAGYSAGGGSGVDRSYVDANFVTLAAEQVVTAHKDFAAGISIYGIPWEYDVERDAWTIKGNVIITKGLATYSALKEDDVLSVFDGLPIDSRTIVWNNGVLEVNEDMIGGLDEDALKDYLDTNKYATQTWIGEQKYTTEKWIEDKKFVSEDDLAEKYVTIDTEQTITGLKDFTGGFKISGASISYNAEKNAFVLPANVIIEGGLATYSTLNNENVISVYDGLPIDGSTIYWSIDANGDKILTAAASGGIDESQLEDYLTTNGYATQTWVTNKGYALQSSLTAVDDRLKSVETFFATDDTDSYVNKWDEIVTFLNAVEGDTLDDILSTKFDKSSFTYSNIKSTLGIYSWALASSKPSYAFSEITSKPTTLSGYGITNAYTKTEVEDNFLALTGGQLSGNLEVYKSTAYIWANNNGANSIGLRAGYDVGLRHRNSSNVEQWALAVANSGNGMWTRFPLAVNMSVDEPRSAYSLYVNGDSYTTGTFYLNGAPLTYNSSKNAWQLEGNLIVTGGLATYTKLSGFTNLDVMGGVVVDGTTIHINSAGQLEVIGGTSGGGSVSITGAASTIVSSNLTASRALISNSSGKVAVSAVTSTELGYLDGVTSAIQTQLNNKQATLVSGTNIKTINGTSILGSGNITISGGSSSSVAESLATPRSIWGKSFDGTADVDGTLTITTSYAALKFSGAGRYDATISLDSTTVMGFSVANKSVFVNKHLYVGGQSSGASVAPLYVSGNAYVTGQVTQANSSDSRLKTNIRKFDVSEYLHSLGGAYAFEYIDSEQERDKYYKGTHIGFIYQNVKESMLQGMCVEREDGFGALNFLNSDYLALLGASAISHEDRIHSLEQQITELQTELNQLRKSA